MPDKPGLTDRFSQLSIKKKLQLLTLLFIIAIMGTGAYTALSLNQRKYEGVVINIAGRQRMLTQKFTKEFLLALHAAEESGTEPDLAGADRTRELFDISLEALINGGQTFLDLGMNQPIQLPPAEAEIAVQLRRVKALWQAQQHAMQAAATSADSIERLEAISAQSLEVLATMNRAVVMFSDDSQKKIAGMVRTQFIVAFIATLIAVFFATLIFQSIIGPINQVVKKTRRITDGDLKNYDDSEELDNEMGRLTANVEQMRVSLHDVINVVQQNSRQMAHSAQQVTTVSADISSSSKLEQENSAQVSEAIRSLLDTSNEVSEHIDVTAKTSSATLEMAQEGVLVVNQSIEELNAAVASVNSTAKQLEELKSFSTKISDITEAIHKIAEQTKLLSLNAAIEAARAGEQGRGFAVVADEVRTLAARTSSSSSEISELISSLMEKVESSVNSMGSVVEAVYQSQEKSARTVESFNSMSDGVRATTDSASVIAGFNEEQKSRLGYLEKRLKELLVVLAESSDKSLTTSMVAKDLHQVSEELDSQLRGFVTESLDSVSSHGDEKRRSPRAENKVKVTVVQGDKRVEALTQDISMHGLKLRSTVALNSRETVNVHCLMPREIAEQVGTELRLSGKVIHCLPTDGHFTCGIRFDGLSEADQARLKDLFRYFRQPYRYHQPAA